MTPSSAPTPGERRPANAPLSLALDTIAVDGPMPTKCRQWRWAKQSDGYGTVKNRGSHRSAHRVYYETFVHPVPREMQVDHICRNRLCVAVEHLEVVTNAQNTQRGRRAKLTPQQTVVIRALYATGRYNLRTLARAFGVHHRTIWGVTSGDTWRAA